MSFCIWRNDTVYKGSCSKDERIMNGIENTLVKFHLDEIDKLLFTYSGNNNFLVTMFNDSNVAKHMNPDLNDSC